MRILRQSVCGIVIFSFLVLAGRFVEAAPASDSWSLERCLEWGLQNHPALTQAECSVDTSQARIGQTRASLGVKMSAGAGWSRQRQEFRRSTAKIGGTDDLLDSTSESVTMRKLLADSGRTRERVRAAEGTNRAAQREFDWQRVQIAGGIKIAYFQALQTRALIDVRRDSLARFDEHLGKVRGMVEVGSRPPYDITKAEVDVANARVELIKAEKDFRNAMAGLAEAVGLEGSLQIDWTSGSAKLPQAPEYDRQKLYQEAMQRPDVRAVVERIQVAGHQVAESKKGLKPSLSGSANYNWSGTLSPLDRSWGMGISLEYPFMDGKLTHYQVTEAKGNLRTAQAKREQLNLSIQTDLEVSLNGIVESFQRLEALGQLMRQASETLNLAEGRYEAGVGSPIEVTDARNSFVSAAGNLVTAQYDVLIALSRLDKNLGRLPGELKTSLAVAPVIGNAGTPDPDALAVDVQGDIGMESDTSPASITPPVIPESSGGK